MNPLDAAEVSAEEMAARIDAAAAAIRRAKAIVFTSGAGLGVDSGLPDFRGTAGFWKAYPIAQKLGLEFRQLANPEWFERDPQLAWGFYGHRMMLYRRTSPHDGYRIVREWQNAPHEKKLFVVTSNVDGAYQKSGYAEEQIWEVHGSLDHLQCMQDDRHCKRPDKIFSSHPYAAVINEETLQCDPASFPKCEHCGSMARPNVMMFNDGYFRFDREQAQEGRFSDWCRRHVLNEGDGALVVVEVGAGTAIPTIRYQSEHLVKRYPGATLVRINVRESHMDDLPTERGISLPMGGLAALRAIDEKLAAAREAA